MTLDPYPSSPKMRFALPPRIAARSASESAAPSTTLAGCEIADRERQIGPEQHLVRADLCHEEIQRRRLEDDGVKVEPGELADGIGHIVRMQ